MRQRIDREGDSSLARDVKGEGMKKREKNEGSRVGETGNV